MHIFTSINCSTLRLRMLRRVCSFLKFARVVAFFKFNTQVWHRLGQKEFIVEKSYYPSPEIWCTKCYFLCRKLLRLRTKLASYCMKYFFLSKFLSIVIISRIRLNSGQFISDVTLLGGGTEPKNLNICCSTL